MEIGTYSILDKELSMQQLTPQQSDKMNIFAVTFTNGSSVFIQATNEKHARRIVERNGTTWSRGDDQIEMKIENIYCLVDEIKK